MKKLTMTTIVILDDKEEHFLYKYIQSNGHTESFISELKGTGRAEKKQSSGTIDLVTVAQIESVPMLGDS